MLPPPGIGRRSVIDLYICALGRTAGIFVLLVGSMASAIMALHVDELHGGDSYHHSFGGAAHCPDEGGALVSVPLAGGCVGVRIFLAIVNKPLPLNSMIAHQPGEASFPKPSICPHA